MPACPPSPAQAPAGRACAPAHPLVPVCSRLLPQSVAVAPFIINYSGALFREYPGPWQVMLRQDNGVYACVAGEAPC